MDGQFDFDHLRDMMQDYIFAFIESAIQQAADFAVAKKLHQERMKDVCYSIKAHYHWEAFGCFFPSEFSQQCDYCGETISPEFDMRRHVGLCDLKDQLADDACYGLTANESFYPHLYPISPHLA